MTIPPTGLPAPTCAPVFLHSRHETALCSSLIEYLLLHSYCMQTLHHAKLQNALVGSLLGSSRPVWASRRPRRCPQSTTVALGVPGQRTVVAWKFELPIATIIRSLSHLCWFECMQVNELTSSASYTSIWRPARAKAAQTMPKASPKLTTAASATKSPPTSPRNGSLQLFDQFTSIAQCTLTASKHSATANFKMPWRGRC